MYVNGQSYDFYVSQINASVVPLPATFPLFGSALAGLGGFGLAETAAAQMMSVHDAVQLAASLCTIGGTACDICRWLFKKIEFEPEAFRL